MGKLINWILASNRYKHIIGGALIGLCADSTYCAAYSGIGVAAALELKDRSWGGEWDWIDFSCTCIGAATGWLLHICIW